MGERGGEERKREIRDLIEHLNLKFLMFREIYVFSECFEVLLRIFLPFSFFCMPLPCLLLASCLPLACLFLAFCLPLACLSVHSTWLLHASSLPLFARCVAPSSCLFLASTFTTGSCVHCTWLLHAPYLPLACPSCTFYLAFARVASYLPLPRLLLAPTFFPSLRAPCHVQPFVTVFIFLLS
jgi:hypothetical protein